MAVVLSNPNLYIRRVNYDIYNWVDYVSFQVIAPFGQDDWPNPTLRRYNPNLYAVRDYIKVPPTPIPFVQTTDWPLQARRAPPRTVLWVQGLTQTAAGPPPPNPGFPPGAALNIFFG